LKGNGTERKVYNYTRRQPQNTKKAITNASDEKKSNTLIENIP
jgi:hypothetical protein